MFPLSYKKHCLNVLRTFKKSCNDWSKACGSMCSKIFNRQNQTGKVSGQKQEYQRQDRNVNNTRQKSGSQAQVQNSKVGQSGFKHRDNKQQDE